MTPISATGRADRRAAQPAQRGKSAGHRARQPRRNPARQGSEALSNLPEKLSEKAGCRAGFTLVELMVTIAIVGLAAGAVVLSVPDPAPSVNATADQFAARLSRAREEAVLANRAVAVTVDGRGYGFQRLEDGRWADLVEGPFRAAPWDEGVEADADPARTVFDPTGVADPLTVRLTRDGRSRTVRLDGAGEVRIDG